MTLESASENKPNWATDVKKPDAQQQDAAATVTDDPDSEEPWEEVVPLGSRLVPPPFPLSSLPDWGKAMVEGVAEETQTAPDIAAAFFLGGLSTAAGGKAIIRVRGGWHEPTNLYLVPVAPPGTRKSAVFRAMTSPLYAAEEALVIAGRTKIRMAELLRLQLEEADRVAKSKAAKSGDANDLAQAESTAIALEETPLPNEVQLIAKNVTPEECSTILSEQGGRLAILSAEGDIFDIVCGRYSNGVPALTPFLEAHAGDVLKVNRRGRSEYVQSPALTIAVCVQPAVLSFIAEKPRLRGQGMLARYLYSLPQDTVGYRKSEPDLIPDHVRDTFEEKMKALVVGLAEWDKPQILTMSTAAVKLVIEFQDEIEPKLRANGGELNSLRDWASKLVGAAVRIAALLHLAAHVDDGFRHPITDGTMQKAIEIGRYYTTHAAACFGVMVEDPHLELARSAVEWLKTNEKVAKDKVFTQRDLFRALQAKFVKSATAGQALSLLDSHGYVRLLPAPPRNSRGGRAPSPKYSVNPSLFGTSDRTDRTPCPAKTTATEGRTKP